MDKFIPQFQNVKFITIDTEGHEPFVLEGSIKTIDKFRPAVIIEVIPKLLKKYSKSDISAIYTFFYQRNYECYKINRLSLAKVTEAGLTNSKNANWICIPKELAAIRKKVTRDLFVRAVIPWFFLKKLPTQ